MTRNDIRESIIDILKDINPDEDYEGLKDDVSFREQLSMDSMDSMDIILELRRRYKIQIPEADYPQLSSMDSTLNYLEPLLKDR